MKRYTRILIGAIAAIITFGSLMAFVGKGHHTEHYNHHRGQRHGCYHNNINDGTSYHISPKLK